VRGVQADMSRRTKAANAALMGSTRRIVLGDTLLTVSADEIGYPRAQISHHQQNIPSYRRRNGFDGDRILIARW
jgi:hypothetical protein